MMRLLWLDYRAAMRERKTWLAGAMLVYAVLSIPVVLAQPPPHVREAIAAWFHDADPFVVFMFVWIDLAMNKAIAFLPVVLASTVLLRERDTGVLAILAAKPLSLARYFVVRTGSACAVMATLHVGSQLLGALWFPGQVENFRPGVFLAAMSLHLFAAVCATACAATLAVATGRRGASALLSLMIFGILVGMALVGFYQPAWQTATLANPFTLGALSLGHLGALGPGVLLPPMLALTALTVITIAAGARLAGRMEA
ncbi:hypothetical protein [Nannocystis pusilla]|uniref:ABC transporter permease n=1 Tax=Nannocystis pusilla TaxID=889268 RepID=A0ABS7U6K7_9BACT|nr:hypothetical protein [Nannocystis pusilla]MBZ5716031.1 hypothetical protein [Nannocystis pusilla]